MRQIVDEEYSPGFEAVRLDTINRILYNRSSTAEINEEFELEQSEADLKLLFEGFRLLSAAGPSLLQVSDKLVHNSNVIENQPGCHFFSV